MNAKKFFVVLMAVLMLGAAGTTFAGDRHGGYRGNDYRGHHHGDYRGDYGHRVYERHKFGRAIRDLGFLGAGVIIGGAINAYHQRCWYEPYPAYDYYGRPAGTQMIQVCAQN